MTPKKAIPKGLAHLVTVGTTPPGLTDDVVTALIADLKPAAPRRVVVLATDDSVGNADRLIKGLGLKRDAGRVRLLASAQSLDEAYLATNEEIYRLLEEGIDAGSILLHYTAGTKVMSAGAVLAAVNNDVQSLRYLYSEGRRKGSVPVTTPTSSVMGDKQLRLSTTLLFEMRFRSARDTAETLDDSLLTAHQAELRALLIRLASAYEDWDRFRIGEFLASYDSLSGELGRFPALAQLVVPPRHLALLRRMSEAAAQDANYPDELLIELFNNAIRRLMEGRPDDALIRLHRAAELYAQGILKDEFGIRTDDVEIRKVPPRYRMAFEAERRLEDAKIKLGLRRSYELLEVLGHPMGEAYRAHVRFQSILNERRDLVLAHGTRPATMNIALDFLREVEELFVMRIGDLPARAARQQFPWIDNKAVLDQLRRGASSVDAAPPRPGKRNAGRSRGKKSAAGGGRGKR